MDGNYIKICRSLLDWEWYTDENTMRLFIHCLLKANWKDGRFQGVEVPRGSFVTSIPRLSEELGISTQSVRTAISHLKSTGELTVKSHPKFSVFTINNYTHYQSTNRQTNSQLTGNQQATNNNRRSKEDNKSISKDILSVMNAWNELELTQLRAIGSTRETMLKARIKEHGLDGVLEAIGNIKKSRFLQGGGSNGWVITFDWFIKPNNFQKVLEGNYNDTKAKKKGGTSGFKLYD